MINRPEWVVTELACGSYSYISVPLYDTLGADAVKYIINHAEITALFCTPDKLQNLLPQLSELPSVRLIVVRFPPPTLCKVALSMCGSGIVDFVRNGFCPCSSIK
jgi:long-subunit acyl-CoA synthetase (AMP-forming)